MNGHVGPPVDEGAVKLLRPEALASDFGKRPILHDVPGGSDRNDLDPLRPPVERLAQSLRHHARLGEGERRSARSDAKRLFHAALVLAASPVAGKAG
jgi:hypothetical protein